MILILIVLICACNNSKNQHIDNYLDKINIPKNERNNIIILQTQYCGPCLDEILLNINKSERLFKNYKFIVVKSSKILHSQFEILQRYFNVTIDDKALFNKTEINPYENTLILYENNSYKIETFDIQTIKNILK